VVVAGGGCSRGDGAVEAVHAAAGVTAGVGVQTGSCAGGQALGSHAVEAGEIYTCSARGVHGQLEVEGAAQPRPAEWNPM